MKKFAAFVLVAVLAVTSLLTVACSAPPIVYLQYNNGSPVEMLQYNDDFELPSPQRDGYVFDGWFLDEDFNKPFTNGSPMENNFHLYAKWIQDVVFERKFKVTFVYNDNSTNDLVVEVVEGDPVAFPATPAQQGYVFTGWYTTLQGNVQWLENQPVQGDITLYAHWTEQQQGGGGQGGGTHTHNFGNNYFAYVQCSCGEWGRNENTSKIITSGDLTYSASRKTQITNSYNSLVRQIQAGGNNSGSAIGNYNSFVSYLDDIGNQYQYAQVLYDVYGDAYEDIYYDLYDFYDQMFAWYYNLFAEFYNSDFKDDFYRYYTQDEIQEVLQEAESYGDGTSQSEINEILQEYNNTDSLREISSLYDRFVNANNAIATQAGYSDYMEYAYANEYARDYTPADVAQMRQYVKRYIGPVYEKLAKSNYNAAQSDDAAFYNALYSSTVFGSAVSPSEATRTAVYYISNYFKWLSEPSGIDFYNSANDMFRNGTYFTGSGEGAYTWYIYGKSSPITYFQADSGYYDTAFTFVHEFGHYYENVYNQDLTLSMDHDETQSQGDEMLFLAWLSQNKAAGVDAGYDKLAAAQLTDILSTVILSTAVDEFEQAAYSHTYNGESVGGSNYDYNALFDDILSSYVADDSLDNEYWAYVVFDNAAYYISYAMSALPAVEIYAKAITNGLTSARDSYLKLFTFADQSQFVETDDYGKYILDGVTYEDILHWAGLSSAFEESLYTTIQQIAQ